MIYSRPGSGLYEIEIQTPEGLDRYGGRWRRLTMDKDALIRRIVILSVLCGANIWLGGMQLGYVIRGDTPMPMLQAIIAIANFCMAWKLDAAQRSIKLLLD